MLHEEAAATGKPYILIGGVVGWGIRNFVPNNTRNAKSTRAKITYDDHL
jgi:hypothetical protein